MPEITLRNGKVYKNFEVLNYGDNVLSAKWDGGRGTVSYDLLPDDVRVEAEKHRPGGGSSGSAPGESQLSIAKQRAAMERRMNEADRKVRSYEAAMRAGQKPTILRSEYDEARIDYRDAKQKFDELTRKLQ